MVDLKDLACLGISAGNAKNGPAAWLSAKYAIRRIMQFPANSK
jgi:hypothetical protein